MLASEIIRRVKEIQVRTGRQVADVLAGEYVSVFKGGGVEFDEVRPYVPGDDVRSIDWNVTARTGEPYVKRYVEERQLTLMLMADVSASQDFGSATRSKREAAAELCALLAFSAIRNDDKVGLVLFHGGIEQFIPPRKGQKHALRVVREVLAHGEGTPEEEAGRAKGAAGATRRLGGAAAATGRSRAQTPAAGTESGRTDSVGDGADNEASGQPRSMGPGLVEASRRKRESGGDGIFARALAAVSSAFGSNRGRRLRSARQATDVAGAMRFLLSVSKRKTVCFVVSDFLDEGFEQALLTANQKHDVIAVLISDPRELEMPDVGLVALEDAETGRARLYDTGSAAFRQTLEEDAARRVAALEHRLRSSGIDFIHIDAAGSVVDPLVKFFRMRERRMRR